MTPHGTASWDTAPPLPSPPTTTTTTTTTSSSSKAKSKAKSKPKATPTATDLAFARARRARHQRSARFVRDLWYRHAPTNVALVNEVLASLLRLFPVHLRADPQMLFGVFAAADAAVALALVGLNRVDDVRRVGTKVINDLPVVRALGLFVDRGDARRELARIEDLAIKRAKQAESKGKQDD